MIHWKIAKFDWRLGLVAWLWISPLAIAQAAKDTVEFTAQAQARPNIVMAFADDWGRYASCYGQLEPGTCNDLVKTPNFDQIAREGVLFRNAFINAPSCTPCRSSLLTGQHFWRCRSASILSGAVWDESLPTYPLMLEASGYHIGHTYKVWSPGTPVDQPHGGNRTRYNKFGGRINQFSEVVHVAPNRKEITEAVLDEVRQNIRSFLESVPTDTPFCYFFGPTNVHRTWVAGSGEAIWSISPDLLDGKLPPFWPDVPIVRQDLADYLGEVQAWDAALGVLVDELKRAGVYDNTLLAISGDHGIPGFPCGKCDLYDTGTRVPLAIRWPKQATPSIVDDLVSIPDLAPTFLEAAGLEIPEVMTARSLIPIVQRAPNAPADPTRDAVFMGRERHVASARAKDLPYPMRAIRTKDYLYIYNFHPERWPMGEAPGFGKPKGPMPSYAEFEKDTHVGFADLDASPTKAWVIEHRNEEEVAPIFHRMVGRRPNVELYDLKLDPHQMKNVASNPELSSVEKELHDRLFAELERTGDPRLKDDGAYFETLGGAGRTD